MKRVLRPFGVLAACAWLVFAGCAQTGGRATQYGPGEQARAAELFAALQAGVAGGELDRAAAAAEEIINSYPRFARIDEVYLLAGQAADGQGRHPQAAAYYDRLCTDHPASAFRARALEAAAADYARLDDPRREAERLLDLEALPADAKERAEVARRLTALAEDRLSAADLDALARRHPDSALARTSLIKQARAAYANGDYDRCYELTGTYLASLPRGEGADDARRLLENAAERRQTPPPGPATKVSPDRVGLLFPQTGSLALYGRLFEQGVRIAVEEHNTSGARRVELVLADSRGGAVDAVKAVRKLAVEDGAIAMVGDVFTLPAIAGAIESNAWRTPIVSPVVASDDLVDIGAWVFQTRVPATIEATVLAETATGRLGLDRFAILAPVRGDRRAVADFFAEEIRRLGHQVIAVEYFNEGATDFRAQFEKIREAGPDALFAAGSIDELMQMLPQTRFFDLQVQLLGLSQWNSEKLLRLAREELEGAVFPAESHYGATPEGERALREKIVAAGAAGASPVSIAGYYGMRAVLEAVAAGATSREDVRAHLEKRLRGDAAARRERAATVPLVRVRAGVTEPFSR